MKTFSSLFAAVLLLGLCATAQAASPEVESATKDLVSQNSDTIISAVDTLGRLGDEAALPALQALQNDQLLAAPDGQPVIVDSNTKTAKYALTGQPYTGSQDALQSPGTDNMVRRSLDTVVATLSLTSPDRRSRLKAAADLADNPDPAMLPAISKALSQEKDRQISKKLALDVALINLNGTDKTKRIAAIKTLGDSGDQALLAKLQVLLEKNDDGSYAEPDADVRAAARSAESSLQHKAALVNTIRNLFYGVSLGSVMLLVALGLAITFGLMGVINMAHGEMLMLGAYSTYVVQQIFARYLPGMADWYLPCAVPLAFLVPCCVGILLERTIIRHLYGRPLETLLATWGISLVLIQAVRLIFGAPNVEVHNPKWLSGGYQVTTGLLLTYNRIAIIIFALLVVGAVWYLLQKTSLGLKVRAVTQSRSIASAMGIFANRIDMWTFGLGCGIAGLGGLALTQISNVNPELGQNYIVDSFLVVVLGGVGKIAGTIAGAFGLGILNKLLEPFAGAVLGKILLLALVILFIQKRPQGIFAVKGRMMED